jgi:hypothetical protein
MSVRCPDGHLSESTDYCDVCGLPIEAASSPPPLPTSSLDLAPTTPVPTAGGMTSREKSCPNCQSVVPADDLFCEVCGYDFTTDTAPPTAPTPLIDPSVTQTGAHATITLGPGSGAAAGTGSAPAPTAGSGPAAGAGSGPGPGAGKLSWVAEVWVDPDWYATQESDEPCPSAGMPMVKPLWETSVLVGRRSVSRNIHPQVDCGADHGVSRRHAQLTTDGQRWWAEDLQSSNGTFIGQAGAPIPTAPISPGLRIEFAPGDRLYVGAWTRIVVRKATDDEH